MSEVLIEFAEPLLGKTDGSLEEQKKAFSIAIMAWNFAVAGDIEDWHKGKIPYLERKIMGSLAKLSRILLILRMHAHDLNLEPSETTYYRL